MWALVVFAPCVLKMSVQTSGFHGGHVRIDLRIPTDVKHSCYTLSKVPFCHPADVQTHRRKRANDQPTSEVVLKTVILLERKAIESTGPGCCRPNAMFG